MNYEPELLFSEESITLDKPYAAKVTTEDELAGYLKRGWKIVMELSEKRYLIKKQYRR